MLSAGGGTLSRIERLSTIHGIIPDRSGLESHEPIDKVFCERVLAPSLSMLDGYGREWHPALACLLIDE